jgi:RHS repeat-associated protein
VTDLIGKPLLMLDSSRRVTGAAEYEPFGLPNRVSLNKETAHPYANGTNVTLADFVQPLGGTANPSTQVRVRVVFDLIDTEGPSATPADYVFLKDPDGGSALTPNIGGPHRGQVWSPWVVPSAGRVQVPFISNATGNTYTGVVMAGYEYQRFQTGAQPFWTPLGFPGQYYDAETDLFQNWNRFYDSGLGRYLEPEPMLYKPNAPQLAALEGYSTPVYAYAGNSPIASYDSDGLYKREGKNTCPDYNRALDLAKEMVCPKGPPPACQDGRSSGGGDSFGGSRCQRAQRGCNICKILQDGSGPGLNFDTYSCDGKTSTDQQHVSICSQICAGGDTTYTLALTLIHEAMHTCGKSECQARQVEEVCGGNLKVYSETGGTGCVPYQED